MKKKNHYHISSREVHKEAVWEMITRIRKSYSCLLNVLVEKTCAVSLHVPITSRWLSVLRFGSEYKGTKRGRSLSSGYFVDSILDLGAFSVEWFA